MRGWRFMLGGLIVWTVHFFALYAIASIFLTTPVARIVALLVSLGCLAADALLFVRAWRHRPVDEPDAWVRRLALLGIAISGVAVLWQALPALIA